MIDQFVKSISFQLLSFGINVLNFEIQFIALSITKIITKTINDREPARPYYMCRTLINPEATLYSILIGFQG